MNIGEILEIEKPMIDALKLISKRGTTHIIVKNEGDVEKFVTGLIIPIDDYIKEIEKEFEYLHKEVEKYK